MIRAFPFAFACLATAAAAQQSPVDTAQLAAERLISAGLSLTRADSARDRVAALTETVQAYEDGLVAMRDGLRRAAIRQRTIETDLAAKSDDVARLLGVLQTIGRVPEPLLLLHPSGPTGTARAGMILADVTPAFQTEVDVLRAQLQEVEDLRLLQDSAADTLRDGLQGAQTARAALSNAISDRTDLPRRFTEDSVQMAVLLASTDTLAAFAGGLADTAIDLSDAALPDAQTLKGDIPLPVSGQILRRADEADAAGIIRPGILIATQPRALVTAPVAATVRYRGPLLNYGNVVILEPAADVLWVLAGMAEVFGDVGEVLPQGAPVGLMGGTLPDVDAILTETSQGNAGRRTQTLYLEVRDGQVTTDPATWFAVE